MFVPNGAIEKKTVLVKIMAWCGLSEPVLTRFPDAYMRAPMCVYNIIGMYWTGQYMR